MELFNLRDVYNTTDIIASIEGRQDIDANWCNIKIIAKDEKNYFENVQPTLEVRDLTRLENWFSNLRSRELPKSTYFSTTEFQFELDCHGYINQDLLTITLRLNSDLRPQFDYHGKKIIRDKKIKKGKANFLKETWVSTHILSNQDIDDILNNLHLINQEIPDINKLRSRESNLIELYKSLKENIEVIYFYDHKYAKFKEIQYKFCRISPICKQELSVGDIIICDKEDSRINEVFSKIEDVHTNKYYVGHRNWVTKNQILGKLIDYYENHEDYN
ncbi:hypothetical protein COW36_09375 [bacterium (Candidatus Blackallbacteria) CG17_big_fil_post_rev_8_21_14_2_50_48_46]|uniref:Uncharacterized protein n=1 Tax=bacterium (Candidatus Blackallbacteria) CG17_big_fil_post_rev_8_21_14_2_50_48_46 TaxID=2014261 RepID=A0A2M7G5I5_9BACT|nr:MAG: hypothetical protein COW64_06225 [bacterium (Candidatus Blackallbacteria) CG18_big_fil_WC_8_21_14_2_50_49_26]PIW17272.1 MAG: hypothetical protein COW36_09375 [bacterium (Candidatus Blackallbacteria) CG17_big_fil_post_rev_8_21_14_2_50_48_46]